MENKNEIVSATSLLFSIAHADEIIDDKEIRLIKEIIIDFFKISNIKLCDEIIEIAKNEYNKSIDLFDFSKVLNNKWSYQDKIDFICCTYEIAFIDGDLHYMEEGIIKKIAIILNVSFQDLISAKIEIKNLLK